MTNGVALAKSRALESPSGKPGQQFSENLLICRDFLL